MDTDSINSYWSSGRVSLRAVEPGDWESYYTWSQDDDMAQRLYAIPFPQSRETTRRWADQESTRKPDGDNFRFVIQDESGKAVGDLTVHDCDRRNGTFSYGIGVQQVARRRGYAKEAVTVVLRYYFQELRYQKVTVTIYSFNEASVDLHEALGFQREGRLRRMGYSEGVYFDHLIYGITAEEFIAGQSGTTQQPM